jgi:hypothetical protein
MRRFQVFDTGFGGGVTVTTGVLDASGVARILVGADGGDGNPNDKPVFRVFGGNGALLTDYVFAFEPSYHGGINMGTTLDGRGLALVLAAPARAHTPQVDIFSADLMLPPQTFTVLTPGTNTSDPNFANGVNLGG